MAYAPHTNDDVRRELKAGIVPTPHPIIFGRFREREFGVMFEYAERRWPDDAYHPELPHIVYVGGSEGAARLAKVLKTVAYVLVDEDMIEKWVLKSHVVYDTSWVRA